MAEQEENANSDAVVTMVDVLKEQEDFEENANAVLGASDDKNCTYQKGYVKRQALYACLTCCGDSKTDATKRAGLCLACSLTCHENHELVELYTKRNFRCDCGGPKFNSHPCQFAPLKRDLNNDNKYNQNFSGIYCICHRPYPDPEATTEEEMMQCIICEDWLHTGHLEAKVPANDQYSEMICKQCMDSHCFLDDYIEHSVNADTEFLDNSDLDILNSSGLNTDKMNDSNKSEKNVSISENEEMELGNKKLVNEDINEQQHIMPNANEQEEVSKKSETHEVNKSQVDGKENISSEQLIDILDKKQVDGKENDSSSEQLMDILDKTQADRKENDTSSEPLKDIPGQSQVDGKENDIASDQLIDILDKTEVDGKENDTASEQLMDILDKSHADRKENDTSSEQLKDLLDKSQVDGKEHATSAEQLIDIPDKTQVVRKENSEQSIDILDKSQVDRKENYSSSEQLMDTVHVHNETSGGKENNPGDNEEDNHVDNEKDNPGDTEKDIPSNNEKGDSGDVNPNVEEADFQIKELRDVNQGHDKILVNNLDDVIPNTETCSQEENIHSKEPNRMEDIISNFNADDSNPNIESNSQSKEFGKTNQVDENISNDKERETNPKMETASQSRELRDSNVVDIVPSENDEILSQTTAENNSTLAVDNSTPNETICEKVNSSMSVQKQEEICPGNKILQDKPLEVTTPDSKYDAALTSEQTKDVNTTGLPTSDEKGDISSSQNDNLDNFITTITDEERDTDTSIEIEKIKNEESNATISQREDNGKTKKEVEDTPNTSNIFENINFAEPVSAILVQKPEHNEGANDEVDKNDKSTRTEKSETKEKINSEFMDTSNTNDLEIINEEKSNIDKLQTTANDTDKCDNIDKDLVAPGEKDKQDCMDIDEKEERVSSAQEQDKQLLHVDAISPKTIQDYDSKEEFKEKASDNDEINMLEKQEDLEISMPSEGNPNNVISDETESLAKEDNDKIESEMEDGDGMVAESINEQKCTKISDENITEGQEHQKSGENAIVDSNDIEMNETEISDAKIVMEVTNNDERMNEDISETKTNSTNENDGSNENDIAKREKFGVKGNEVNGNTLDVRKDISEDVDMADIDPTACTTRSDSENGLHLHNTEKCVEKHTECKIQESTLEASSTSDSQSIKRKQDSENFIEGKKIKIEANVDVTDTSESIQCLRPHKPKNGHNGATFWPCNWRKKLCSCFNCVAMYRNNDVLFLIDVEDTVSAYEDLGKSTNANSQYAKGLEALSSLDRIQQINAITEYNKMKEKLLDFLKSFKDKREVVKEEDIKEFFAGMKPRREPDGVYFCR